MVTKGSDTAIVSVTVYALSAAGAAALASVPVDGVAAGCCNDDNGGTDGGGGSGDAGLRGC